MGWVINLHSKYWRDVFFRTELNVIVLQIFFAAVLLVAVSVSFNYLYRDLLQTLIQGITESILNNGSLTGQNILDSMEVLKARNFLNFFAITLFITLFFSYVIARVTLTPVRNALKSQKRFIGDVAHELRTPLSVLKANNEVALLDDMREDLKDIFKSNIEELDRASAIINNLLSFSNLIRPEQMKFIHVDMSLVIDTAISKLESLANSKGTEIIVKKIGPTGVYGNPTALEQIVINLVKNSINYSKPSGHVTIKVEPDYYDVNRLIFSVEDDGIGISEKDLEHIFEPFFRAETSRNKKQGTGSGLGLTIVSELVKIHRACISMVLLDLLK